MGAVLSLANWQPGVTAFTMCVLTMLFLLV